MVVTGFFAQCRITVTYLYVKFSLVVYGDVMVLFTLFGKVMKEGWK